MAPVLVVDDSLHIRSGCRQQLHSMGHRVLLARDGIEALEVIETIRVDLVVLDVQMPRLGGIEAMYRVRERDARLPIILHTALGVDGVEARHREVATMCLDKGEDAEAFQNAVAEVLATHRRIQEAHRGGETC
jgi:chemosensory pili system protein ChpA (sensor histidine kinase/response regulator)